MKCVHDTMVPDKKSRSHFELFGYDFLIDTSYKLWLLEVNTNPCLEESSRLLEQYIPRMLDDMLKLTLDVRYRR